MLLVAVDDGYAQAKVYGEDAEGRRIRAVSRSSIKSGRHIGALSGGGYMGAYTVEAGGHRETFTISDAIEGESTRFDGFHVSPMNRALVTHALLAAGLAGREVDLVTGVPVNLFFQGSRRNDELLARKRANLIEPVEVEGEEAGAPKIARVRVFAQAAAAWVDHVLDDELKERNDPEARVAVVDIGGRTTDVAVVYGGSTIDHARSGTEDIGALEVYRGLEGLVRAAWNNNDPISLSRLAGAVRTGKLDKFGRPQDVSALVRQAVDDVEGRIVRAVQRRIGEGSDLAAVLLVGGGVNIFKGIGARFPENGVMVEDPEFANARGLWKYAKTFADAG